MRGAGPPPIALVRASIDSNKSNGRWCRGANDNAHHYHCQRWRPVHQLHKQRSPGSRRSQICIQVRVGWRQHTLATCLAPHRATYEGAVLYCTQTRGVGSTT
eukprot:SAG25_NODE_9_length_28981_cov_95.245274_22_plen_102_part_00